jgi:hypothetical protein
MTMTMIMTMNGIWNMNMILETLRWFKMAHPRHKDLILT